MTETPTWTRADASSLQLTPATVTPVIESPDSRVDDDLHVWDTWLLRERDGSVAEIDGYRVLFALTASADLLPGTRHDVATIRYFYSRDGRSWTCGGPAFEADRALGSRQWAGSALYDGGQVFLFDTAAGDTDAVGHGEVSHP
jgi:levansucrase